MDESTIAARRFLRPTLLGRPHLGRPIAVGRRVDDVAARTQAADTVGAGVIREALRLPASAYRGETVEVRAGAY